VPSSRNTGVGADDLISAADKKLFLMRRTAYNHSFASEKKTTKYLVLPGTAATHIHSHKLKQHYSKPISSTDVYCLIGLLFSVLPGTCFTMCCVYTLCLKNKTLNSCPWGPTYTAGGNSERQLKLTRSNSAGRSPGITAATRRQLHAEIHPEARRVNYS